MAHEITVRADGRAEAAFALTPAWHGLGVVLDHPMSSQEALTCGGLDWNVIQRPMGMIVPAEIETPEGPVTGQQIVEIPELMANVREDTSLFLGDVSDRYQVVQNREAFAFLDSLVDDGAMQFESAFSLSGGKRVVLLGRLPQVDTVAPGDEVKRYVLFGLHHDGTGGIKFGPVHERVVCANTYAIALSEGTTEELTIRHTGKIQEKLARAREILAHANKRFDEQTELCQVLARHQMDHAEWSAYLDVLCPILDPRDPDWSDRRASAVEQTRDAIRMAWVNERQLMPSIAGTAWAAYNAVGEHIDHLPRRGVGTRQKAECRFNICLHSTGMDMKRRAFETACRFAGLAVAG